MKKKVAVAMSGPVKSRLSSGSRGKGSGKVVVAMSGGVDSGVAAGLLVKAGYKCVGFHMKLWAESVTSYQSPVTGFENKCCSTESLEAARKTAHKLGMPFYIVDFEKIFKKRVVDYFLKEYSAGLTPNPCVICNKYIKFGQLLDYVRKLGFDYLATGHYARTRRNTVHDTRNTKKRKERVTCHLLRALDESKDQSYFLYNLTQKQLAQVLFPVGDYLKKEVVEMAKKWKLPVARRPESQEICFLPETDYRPFLKRQIPKKIIPGEVVDTNGRVIGKHYGLPLYTIGQRHGFKISAKRKVQSAKLIPPFYVIDKDIKQNRLIVGFGKEAERKEFWVKDINWINQLTAKRLTLDAKVRIRHQGELLKCKIKNVKLKMIKVILEEPERGIAPGQAVVFYSEFQRGTRFSSEARGSYKREEVLGGGIIAIDKN